MRVIRPSLKIDKTCKHSLLHYATCPCNILKYFSAVKIYNFQMKKSDIFLIFAQNIRVTTIYVLEQKLEKYVYPTFPI